MVVRVMLMAVLALSGACDRPREHGAQDTSLAHAAATDAAALARDAAPPALDAAIDAAIDAPPVADAAVGAAPGAAPAAAPGAGAGAELVIASPPPRPGSSSIITFDATLDLDLNFGGMQTITSTRRTKRKKVEILAVEPGGTVEKRITYQKLETNAVVDGERKKDPSPIRGKAYRVTWNDGVLDVRLPDGRPASAAESEAVHGEEGALQSPEMLGKALAGLRLVEGQPFEVPVAMLAKLVRGTYRPRRLVLTYRGKTRDGARIDADAALATDGEGVKMFADLKAALVLDATGWCRSLKVTAQARAELNGNVVGSGAGQATVLATPLR